MRRDFRLCAWLYGFAPGLLLALLFLFPQAAMQGVKDGLLLWTQAVLPALLPFFVVTSLLQSSGALDLLSPLAAPLCRLFRLPKRAGGILLAGWLSGAPNGARLASALCAEGSLPPDACARLTAVCTVTGPLFLVGAAGWAAPRAARCCLPCSCWAQCSTGCCGEITALLPTNRRNSHLFLRNPRCAPCPKRCVKAACRYCSSARPSRCFRHLPRYLTRWGSSGRWSGCCSGPSPRMSCARCCPVFWKSAAAAVKWRRRRFLCRCGCR